MRRCRLSLTATILSALSLVLIITWALLGVVAVKITERSLYSRKSDEARRLVTVLSRLLPEDFATAGESRAVAGFLETLVRDHELRTLVIADAAGRTVLSSPSVPGGDRLLAETLQKRQPLVKISDRYDTISRYAPVFAGNGALKGVVRLTLSLDEENDLLDRFRKLFVAYFALDFLLLLAIGSTLLSRLIVVPVRRLVTATGFIDAGDFSHRVPVSGTIETAELAQSFNSMAESLTRQRNEIGNQVVSLETANRELQQAREETIRTEKLASMGLLAAGMAHEVGAPLAAIMGYAGILRQELHDDPEHADHAARIENDARRIDRIVRHLLDYARPRPGLFVRTDAGEVIRNACELLNSQGLFRNITVRLDIADDLPAVYLDGHQLHQVLINLMINARDAMIGGGELRVSAGAAPSTTGTEDRGPGTAQGPVTGDQGPGNGNTKPSGTREAVSGPLSVMSDSGGHPLPSLWIEVRDSGGGIPPEHMDKLFEPFFTTKEPGKGTGLGLAICARIIDSFNGRITVHSTVGAGSTFTILLPAAGE